MKKILLFATVAFAAGVGACSIDLPANPSFEKDVKPIFESRCVRCHSATGPDGGLQGDPAIYPLGASNKPKGYNIAKPARCHLDVYADVDGGDGCTPGANTLPPASCQMGAHSCATSLYKATFVTYINTGTMPPPPAQKMTEWELDVVDKWLANPLP